MSENAVLYHEYLDRINILRQRILELKRQLDDIDDTVEATQLDARIRGLYEMRSDMMFAAQRLRLYL